MKTRKWTKKELRDHGWEIGYYGGWYVNLKAPPDLSKHEHYQYLEQKAELINSLCKPRKTK